MSIVKRRESLMPTWASDLLDTSRFFSPRLFDLGTDPFSIDFSSRVPSANINETEKEYRIELAVPGMEKDDFKVAIDNGVLYVSSEKEEDREEAEKNYTRREYSFSEFRRSFSLPENCLEDKIKAKYENGILNLILPKKELSIIKPASEIPVL
ncbi:MAG: Hsp20/alpha crystallin family protein [Crocinitomicaceae bacterium]|jgi:HSP20 family protein